MIRPGIFRRLTALPGIFGHWHCEAFRIEHAYDEWELKVVEVGVRCSRHISRLRWIALGVCREHQTITPAVPETQETTP